MSVRSIRTSSLSLTPGTHQAILPRRLPEPRAQSACIGRLYRAPIRRHSDWLARGLDPSLPPFAGQGSHPAHLGDASKGKRSPRPTGSCDRAGRSVRGSAPLWPTSKAREGRGSHATKGILAPEWHQKRRAERPGPPGDGGGRWFVWAAPHGTWRLVGRDRWVRTSDRCAQP
jgi:hypothetical protein